MVLKTYAITSQTYYDWCGSCYETAAIETMVCSVEKKRLAGHWF